MGVGVTTGFCSKTLARRSSQTRLREASTWPVWASTQVTQLAAKAGTGPVSICQASRTSSPIGKYTRPAHSASGSSGGTK